MRTTLLFMIMTTIILCASSMAQVKNGNSFQKDELERSLLGKLELDKDGATFEYFDLNKDGKIDAVIIRGARENSIYNIKPLKQLWTGPAYCTPLAKTHKGYRDIEVSYFGVSTVALLKWTGSQYE